MAADRSKIPEEIKREVRRRCFFGCVVCGMPIFHYDHMKDYAIELVHEEENITLLCPNHHQDKTSGRLKLDRVLHCDKNPYNANRSITAAYKIEPSKSLTLVVGSTISQVKFRHQIELHRVLWVSGEDYLAIHYDNGWLSISADITDAHGKKVVKIREGEIVLATDVSDYRYEGSRLRVFHGDKKLVTVIDITLNSEVVHICQGLFIDHRDRSGYAVTENKLRTIFKGRDVNFTYGDIVSVGNSGAFAMINREIFDETQFRGGFAFVNKFGSRRKIKDK